MRRVAFAVAAAVVVLVATAGSAAAHAILISSTPAGGASLASAPTQVVLTFNEPIQIRTGWLQVFDPGGVRADASAPTHGPGGDRTVSVPLRPGLRHGSYAVSWRVISADSHPVSGAFVFSIGTATVPVRPAVSEGSAAVGIAYGLARWLAFAAFALVVGIPVFLVCCWPPGFVAGGVRRLVWWSWDALLGATIAALLLQGPYGAGRGLGAAADLELWRATLSARLGHLLAVRLLLLVVGEVYLGVLFARWPTAAPRRRRALCAVGGALGGGLALTWAAGGHPGADVQAALAIPADAVHLLAMAVWVGGLALLAAMVLRGRPGAAEAAAVSRFSPIAFGCVTVLAVTGTYQAWRYVGTAPALATTAYGRLLLVKVAGFGGLIALGARARKSLSGRVLPAVHRVPVGVGGPGEPLVAAAPHRPVATGLRRGVAAEVVLAVGVLAATAALVNAQPSRTVRAAAAASPAPRPVVHAHGRLVQTTRTVAFDTRGANGAGVCAVTFSLSPKGTRGLLLRLRDPSGRPRQVPQVTAALSLPARSIGPLAVPLASLGSGVYANAHLDVPLPGDWRLAITIRTSEIDETMLTLPMAVR